MYADLRRFDSTVRAARAMGAEAREFLSGVRRLRTEKHSLASVDVAVISGMKTNVLECTQRPAINRAHRITAETLDRGRFVPAPGFLSDRRMVLTRDRDRRSAPVRPAERSSRRSCGRAPALGTPLRAPGPEGVSDEPRQLPKRASTDEASCDAVPSSARWVMAGAISRPWWAIACA
ncbi:hypothetical protein DFR74_106162 [Nocardia puris]|uniref:Uncharacterized protein n=1 Tax=Nocardia puris TaxID=208602 RepID=A0A366DJM2_9NOCA|nr:hypothetical protein DFR74_106162 [Nocardia puris]